ncbi:SulP family sulfate permease [Tamaricihabitans halophyticus]|uniref:SulP family sulfate permease n=1 Tax=Tamaricihabitans halophyticus TaxID=1262583 RepID=A0A4R2QMY5_9PSEU|nr:SulP family inorganic anion transporter [Tamaricihabitans halophyticus]TCP50807.1 SulP family sulfate permease [Tamaricihabitans halophyticus]
MRLRWLPSRTAPTWPSRGDLLAGPSVALVLIPQSLAYAELAGVPPERGLFTAAAAPAIAAIAGSSRYLQSGPVALTSLLTLGALAPLMATGTAEYAAHAALLAILVGIIRVLLGLLRGGALSYLMSQPVVAGFTVGAAMLIVASQLPTLLGVSAGADNPLVGGWLAITAVDQWQLGPVLLGLSTIAILLGGRKLHALFPGALLATVAGVILGATGFGGAQVGAISGGLPLPSLDLPWASVGALLIPAVVIALVGFAEPAAIARRYAAQDDEPWNANREFVGQGAANLASGLLSGYSVGGSFSRTALNRLSGATSRWSAVFTGLWVLVLLPLAPLLSTLPTAVLAGLVIAAAISLVEIRPFREYWRWSLPQFGVAVPTLILTLLLAPRVELAVLVGVGLAIAVHLWREFRVDIDSWRRGQELHIQLHGVLYFGSAPEVERKLRAALAAQPDAGELVLHLDRVGRLDLTAVLVLRNVLDRVAGEGMPCRFAGIAPSAERLVRKVLRDDATARSVSPGSNTAAPDTAST